MTRIGIIGGAGTVGSTIAFALILKNLGSIIILVDANVEKCQAQVDDLSDSAAMRNGDITVLQGDYKDLTVCNIIIIAAGMKQSPNITDEQLMKKNREIATDIMKNLKPFLSQDTILLVVSNPLD